MANLIITVIAIALVAIASLMGAYYGGSAYIRNQSAANASTVLNQGQQVAAACNAYRGDNGNAVPASLSNLLFTNTVASGGYLAQIPNAPTAPGGVTTYPVFIASATATVSGVSSLHYFMYADLGKPTAGGTAGITDSNAQGCVRVQKTALGAAPTALASAAQGAIFALGNGTFGCGILTGTIAGGLGGTAVPSGDLATGDYVMEYIIQ